MTITTAAEAIAAIAADALTKLDAGQRQTYAAGLRKVADRGQSVKVSATTLKPVGNGPGAITLAPADLRMIATRIEEV